MPPTFGIVCLGLMWATTLAAVYAANRNRRTHGLPWAWWMDAQLSLAFYVSALDAWLWL